MDKRHILAKLWLGFALIALPLAVLLGFEFIQISQTFAPGALRSIGSAVLVSVCALAILAAGVALMLLSLREVRLVRREQGASEERFHALVQGVVDYAIFTLDHEGRVTDWNLGAERLKGYKDDEIISKHFSVFYTAEDRIRDIPGLALRTAKQTGRFEAEGWRVRKDGSQFLANVIINARRDQSGSLLGFAKVTRDITERHFREQALAQTREALTQSQKMDALGQLSGGIAHDFNNLLGVMKNSIEILQRRVGTVTEEAKQYFDMLHRSVDGAAALTQRMLAFSRKQPLEPTIINLTRLISGMTDMLRRALGEAIALEVVSASGAWPVIADANQLEAALVNLVVNARDAMPAGGKLTIETGNIFLDEEYAALHSEVKVGQYGLIAVSDNGAGMPKEIIARAFEPFFTTKSVGKGTGLGLSQVFGFVKQSGGHVKIYSELGEGTTVKLYMPRAMVADQSKPATEVRPSSGRVSKEKTILLVEDDADLATSTAEQLRELGYRVFIALDGHAALKTLESESIDLLFTDVGLPRGMNGRQLAELARHNRPDLKVLYTTGYARNAIVHHGRLDPDVDLIVKPYTQASLGARVAAVLERRPSES